MNLLFTLYTTLHLANPFLPPTPHVFIPQPIVGVSVSVSSHMSTPPQVFGQRSLAAARQIEQQPTTAFNPQTQAGPFPVNGDSSCQTYTSCMNELYGTPAPGYTDPSGYMATCPDGSMAQGSCETPGGKK